MAREESFTMRNLYCTPNDVRMLISKTNNNKHAIGALRHGGMIANAHIKIGNISYEKVKTFKYLGNKM